jgi:putative transcriptional regulator
MLEFLETPAFTRQILVLLRDAEYAALQGTLVVDPEAGDLIRDTGGLRKLRWHERQRGKGKRGGIRIIYYWYEPRRHLHAARIFKGRTRRLVGARETHSEAAGGAGVRMKKQLFDELVGSIRDAGEIHRGERSPSRKFVFKPEDVRRIRRKLRKSQSEFARMIGVSVSTLQNWEQGRRQPEGPARALLLVASKAPQTVAKALASAARRSA